MIDDDDAKVVYDFPPLPSEYSSVSSILCQSNLPQSGYLGAVTSVEPYFTIDCAFLPVSINTYHMWRLTSWFIHT